MTLSHVDAAQPSQAIAGSQGQQHSMTLRSHKRQPQATGIEQPTRSSRRRQDVGDAEGQHHTAIGGGNCSDGDQDMLSPRSRSGLPFEGG